MIVGVLHVGFGPIRNIPDATKLHIKSIAPLHSLNGALCVWPFSLRSDGRQSQLNRSEMTFPPMNESPPGQEKARRASLWCIREGCHAVQFMQLRCAARIVWGPFVHRRSGLRYRRDGDARR
jgi:hypothetical protein